VSKDKELDDPGIILTGDGSHSFISEQFREPYHSWYGAIQESQHVFIHSGLEQFKNHQGPLRIFEMGFGTGLNALLTSIYSQEHQQEIDYYSIEAFPIDHEDLTQLNYHQILNVDQSSFLKLHEANKTQKIHSHFSINVEEITLEKTQLPNDHFNIIYYDAFAPAAQAELWEEPVFRKLIACLKEGGILITYCAKGVVKRAMKAAGFTVEGVPGPPGKREMIRASK